MMLYKIFKFLWFLTIFFAIGANIYVYSGMPDGILNLPMPYTWDKSVFFFSMTGLILLISFIILMPISYLHQIRGIEKKSKTITKEFRLDIVGFMWALGNIINLSFLIVIIYCFSINLPRGEGGPITFWFYLIPIALVVWMISFGINVLKNLKGNLS